MKPKGKSIPNNLVCTINTDASWNQQKSSGGYGIWISSDFFTIQKAGKFKDKITDANESEIKALCVAFWWLEQFISCNVEHKRKGFQRFRLIVVNCDNRVARRIIETHRISDRFKLEGNILLDYVKSYEKVIAKDIRGHQPNINSRQYVNNWCDKASRVGHTNFSL